MKRFISFFLFFSLLIFSFTVVAFADSLPSALGYLGSGGGQYRGGGAGRDLPSTSRAYYTKQNTDLQPFPSYQPNSSTSSLSIQTTYLNSGSTSLYSIQNPSNKTLNYSDGLKQYSYTYNSYNYNEEYNYYTFNIDNREYYVVNNYTYYSIVFPSETQNDVYERVDLFYQLPDGRNSWNLSAGDVWGTYFIYESVNYDEVPEDDGVTLALYHLDGNFYDSSAKSASPISCSTRNFVDTPFSSGIGLHTVTYSKKGFTIPVTSDIVTIEFRMKVSSSCMKSSGPTNVNYCDVNIGPDAYKLSVPTDEWVSVAFVRDLSLSHDDYKVYVNGCYKENTNCFGERFYFQNGDDRSIISLSVIYDEIRLSSDALYSSDYVPRNQPFDTNSILVLPSSGSEGVVAVKSKIPVSDIRVGGVRPTFPTNGYVYAYLENDVVRGCQQFQRDGWYEVDGAIYSGGDWVNFTGYDMKAYSVSNPSPDGSGQSPAPGADGGTNDNSPSGLGDLISSLFGGLVDALTGVFSGLIGLFSSLLTVASGFSNFLSASFAFLPADVISVLGAGVVLMVILAIIKFIRG